MLRVAMWIFANFSYAQWLNHSQEGNKPAQQMLSLLATCPVIVAITSTTVISRLQAGGANYFPEDVGGSGNCGVSS